MGSLSAVGALAALAAFCAVAATRLQFQAVTAREQPIEDRVGDGCVADHACQVLDRQLAGPMVERVPARSSITSIRSERVGPYQRQQAPVVEHQTSVRASAASQRAKPPLPCRMRSSSAKRGCAVQRRVAAAGTRTAPGRMPPMNLLIRSGQRHSATNRLFVSPDSLSVRPEGWVRSSPSSVKFVR